MPPRSVIAMLALARRAAGGQAGFDPDDLDDRLVRRHGLAPLASRLGVDRFRADLAAAALRAATLEAVAGEAIAALVDAGVPVALIKGISLAPTLYEHRGERPMTDVDLLVPRARFADARRRLEQAGFRAGPVPRLHHAIALSGRAVEVDLHRAIAPLGWTRIDEGPLWARARPAAERRDGALRLDPVDETLLQCLVLSRGFWGALIGYVDAARLLARLDAAGRAELLDRARRAGVLRATAAALTVTARIAGTEVPPGTPRLHYPLPALERIAAGDPPAATRRVVHRLGLSDGPRELGAQLAYYAARAADGILAAGGAE